MTWACADPAGEVLKPVAWLTIVPKTTIAEPKAATRQRGGRPRGGVIVCCFAPSLIFQPHAFVRKARLGSARSVRSTVDYRQDFYGRITSRSRIGGTMSSLSDPAELASAEPTDWSKNCSTAELKEIVSAGVAGGDRFIAAVREIERRSAESANRTSSAEMERRRRQAGKDRQVRVGVALAALVLASLAIAFSVT